MNLGCADRAFLTADPSKNSILPIDDAIWEENVGRTAYHQRFNRLHQLERDKCTSTQTL